MYLIGIFVLCFSGVGLAAVFLKRAEANLTRSKALLEFVSFVRSSVENYSMTLSEIFESCPSELLNDCGYPMPEEAPNGLWDFFELCDVDDSRIKSILADFSREFGKNYRYRQSELCGICVDRLRARIGELEGSLPERRRVIIGVCAACTLILLLLLM